VPPEALFSPDQTQTLLYSSDLELGEATKAIFDQVELVKPQRVVLDSLSEIRLLAQSSLRYRRQILALKHYFARSGATVLMLDDLTSEATDKTVHSVAHGVIHLEGIAPDYGAERRRLKVSKYRAQSFRGGYHDFTISGEGSRFSRAWCQRSTELVSSARVSQAVRLSSTTCWVAASKPVQAP